MTRSKVQIEELWSTYQETESVWRTAERFGLAGQTVHERLTKAGYKLKARNFSPEEDAIIRQVYAMSPRARDLNLKNLAKQLDRPHHTNISRRAKELGLTDTTRKLTVGQRDSLSRAQLLALQEGRSPRTYSNVAKGWYETSSGKRYFLKSGWETKYAEYLEILLKTGAILDWEYEPDTFWFEKIKRGVRSYTPDFKITHNDGTIEYHEVKGWMDKKSQTKIKRMAIYHPDVTLVVMMKPELKAIGLI